MRNTMTRLGTILLGTLFLASPALAQEASNKKLGAQQFTATVNVNKAPKAVWAVLTNIAKSGEAMGFVHEKGSKTLQKPGDSARIKLPSWNESGTMTVTYAVPAQDLRMSFEPDNGSYICSDRFQLAAAGKGTKITWTQIYTESGPQSPEDVAKQVAEVKMRIGKIKAAVDGKM